MIDFLVILFLLCFIPMFYYGYKLYREARLTAVTLEAMEREKALAQAKIATQEPEGGNSESGKYEKIIDAQEEEKKVIISLTNQLKDILNRIAAQEQKLNVISSPRKSKK